MRILTALALFSLTSYAAVDLKDVEYARPDGKPVLLDLRIPDGGGSVSSGDSGPRRRLR